MKTAVGMVIAYILVCTAGTAAGAFCYMVFKGCTMFIAGSPLSVFSLSAYIHGICFMLPVSFMLSPFFLTLYAIRHPDFPAFAFIAYIVLNLFTWAAGFPASVRAARSAAIPSDAPPLTSGYFRQIGETVYYFTSVSKADNKNIFASGVSIQADGSSDMIPFDNKIFQDEGEKFKEPLARPFFRLPLALSSAVKTIEVLKNAAFNAMSSGFSAWLSFCSIGLSLTAVYCFSRLSVWRLLNCFFVAISSICICALNGMCYSTHLFNKAQIIVNSWLSTALHVHVPFAAVMNVFIAVSGCITGVIVAISERKRNVTL